MKTTLDTSGRPVLVVGGAGYIGAVTARALDALGIPVLVLDDLSTGHADAVNVPLLRVDLADRAGVRAVLEEHRPAGVLHFAARSLVGESVADPAAYYRANVVNTLTLLEEMRRADCRRIVFSSTCATYGDPVTTPMDEEHPQLPVSPYGRTKLHIEHILGDFVDAYGFSAAVLRYFNAAGASRDGRCGERHDPETHLIPLVLEAAAGLREEILVFGDDWPTPDGTAVRDYIHVEDLADAHVAALAALLDGTRHLACNLGTGRGHSVQEVIDVARRVTGAPIPARIVERRAGDPAVLVCAPRRALDQLGWAARITDLDDIVGDAWNFLRAHTEGRSD